MTVPSDIVRLNQIGPGLDRRLNADAAGREAIRRELGLGAVRELAADVAVAPHGEGWRLSGRIEADVDQTCGITLEPLPTRIDERFAIDLIEGPPPEMEGEVDMDLDVDAPDYVEGHIDLWAYALEQLALALDPFPRKPGVEFVQPEEPAEVSPFSVLTRLKPKDDGQG